MNILMLQISKSRGKEIWSLFLRPHKKVQTLRSISLSTLPLIILLQQIFHKVKMKRIQDYFLIISVYFFPIVY